VVKLWEDISRNPDIVKAALLQDGLALRHVSHPIISDREVVLCAVTQNGLALEWAGKFYRDSKDVVLQALRQNWKAIRFVSKELKTDEDVLKMLRASQDAERGGPYVFDEECYHCGVIGHKCRVCPSGPESEEAQMKRKIKSLSRPCVFCDQPGHRSAKCPNIKENTLPFSLRQNKQSAKQSVERV